MEKLFTVLYGSKLYGTSTPTSDRDVKHVYLPDLNDMLVGRPLENKVKKTNTAVNTRNSATDVDEEFLPLQVFARHFFEGQTYALELAFAVDGTHAEQTFYDEGEVVPHELRYNMLFYTFVRELREKFLTSNIKAMMGYAVNQANLYSFKGERLNVSKEFLEALKVADGLPQTDAQHYTLEMVRSVEPFAGMVEALKTKYPKYFREETYDIGGGRMRECFTVLEKTFPFTSKTQHALGVCEALVGKYGSRAEAASETNVDWKATMHALRIVDQGLELLTLHKMSFPFHREYVEKLLAVKRGEVPLALVREELSSKLEMLKSLEQTTTLKPVSQEFRAEFETWLRDWMRLFYGVDA